MPETHFVQEIAGHSNHGDSVFVKLTESPKEWTKQMEREFRQLHWEGQGQPHCRADGST